MSDCAFPLETLRHGAKDPYVADFARDLLNKNYSRGIVAAHLRAATHFTHWADGLGLSLSDQKESVVQAFCSHLQSCQCTGTYKDKSFHTTAGARSFFSYLQSQGFVQPAALDLKRIDNHPIWDSFEQWMRTHRGVMDSTLRQYKRFVTALLQQLGDDLSRLNPRELRTFIMSRSETGTRHAARSLIKATRTFLRYLVAEGRCPSDLQSAIPRIAGWRLSTVPAHLSQEDIQKIVSTCSYPGAKSGIRNRAIVLLCARLGLRISDVIKLQLDDIDWLGGSLRVAGKGRRETRLPLTQEVGDALLNYVERARPPLNTDHVFASVYPPWRPLAASSSASSMVARLMRRCGVKPPTRGAAHLLRHSAATEMLRQGVSLQDIGTILRHRSLDTTAIYSKVDFKTLLQIAQPWPGGES